MHYMTAVSLEMSDEPNFCFINLSDVVTCRIFYTFVAPKGWDNEPIKQSFY